MTSNFTSPLSQDWLLIPFWTESNKFLGIYWWMIGLQNCIDAIAEILYLPPKNLLNMFLFFIGNVLVFYGNSNLPHALL